MATTRFEVQLQYGSHEVLCHVKQLLQNNTHWTFSGAEFDLIPHPATVALARDEQHTIVGCAVLANPVRDSTTYWVGLVIVAKSYRRMGAATSMLNKLLSGVSNGYVALAAALMAVPLYHSIGFRELTHLTIGYWCLLLDQGGSEEACHIQDDDGHNVRTITDHSDALHSAAKRLYTKVAGNRAFALDYILKHAVKGQCVAYLNEDQRNVYAAAWIRSVQSEGGTGVEAWLGPFVGGTDRTRLKRVLQRVASECARMPGVRRVCCLGSNEALLAEAEFEKVRRVPIMALRVDDGVRTGCDVMDHVELAASSPTQRYHALCDWFAG